jgi:hypothetical protein
VNGILKCDAEVPLKGLRSYKGEDPSDFFTNDKEKAQKSPPGRNHPKSK